jgi:hypothetical protein
LQEGGHVVDPANLVGICASLPKDDKLAAAHLRTHLGAFGIDLKHTHALRAVAQLRGNRSHLGHHGISWEVASWVVDAPAVSARRRRVRTIAAAAEILIERLREQLEDSPPAFVHLKTGPDLELVMPETGWCALAACTDAAGQALAASLRERKHFAERVRRMVEGKFGGWLNGAMYAGESLEPAFDFSVGDDQVLTLAEWEFASAVAKVEHTEPAVDQAQRVLELLRPYIRGLEPQGRAPSAAEIGRLLVRVRNFEQNSGKTFADWAQATTHTPEMYAPQPLNRAGLDAQMKLLRVDRSMIVQAMSLDPGEFDKYLTAGEMPLETMTRLAAALQLESTNSLLGRPPRSRPYIPLHDSESVATFMSRFEHVSLEETVALQLPAKTQALLEKICSVPFERRTHWDEAAPTSDLDSLTGAVRGADSVLCARVATRFVCDLPRKRERLAISMVIGAQPRRVVDQFAPANEEERLPFDTDIDDEWLARFNRKVFVGEDLMRYSNLE